MTNEELVKEIREQQRQRRVDAILTQEKIQQENPYPMRDILSRQGQADFRMGGIEAVLPEGQTEEDVRAEVEKIAKGYKPKYDPFWKEKRDYEESGQKAEDAKKEDDDDAYLSLFDL